MPSRDFSSEDLVSSWMMSLHSSTHSSQMNTVGPAMSLRTSSWLLPQNEQKSEVFESPPATLLILALRQSRAPGILPRFRFVSRVAFDHRSVAVTHTFSSIPRSGRPSFHAL